MSTPRKTGSGDNIVDLGISSAPEVPRNNYSADLGHDEPVIATETDVASIDAVEVLDWPTLFTIDGGEEADASIGHPFDFGSEDDADLSQSPLTDHVDADDV